MKKINLYGYLNGNLGDDLMFYILLNRYPKVLFKYSDYWKNFNKFNKYKNFTSNEDFYIKYGRVNNILNKILPAKFKNCYINKQLTKKVFASVNIGGSIFMQNEHHNCVNDHQISKLKNGPLFVIGSNFGPYKDDTFKDEYKSYFRKCSSVTFRDKASCNLFKELDNVNYASDVVFSDFKLPKEQIKYNDYVLFSLVDIYKKAGLKNKSDYFKCISGIIEECKKNKKIPCLVSFCKNEGDEDLIEDYLRTLSVDERNALDIKFYDSDIEEFLSLFMSCHGVVASRFHAMILALKFNKPFYALSYSDKTNNYLLDNKLDNYCNIKEINSIDPNEVYTEFFLNPSIYYDLDIIDPFTDLDEYLSKLNLL